MILTDADTVTSNKFSIRLIGDSSHALNITYNIMPIEHPRFPNRAPYTAIFPSEYQAFVQHCLHSHYNSFLMDVRTYIFHTRNCKFISHFPAIHARKTLLPESPYHVVLQVTDESLLKGYGANSVSQYRFYVVDTHWQTAWLHSLHLQNCQRTMAKYLKCLSKIAHGKVPAKFLNCPFHFRVQRILKYFYLLRNLFRNCEQFRLTFYFAPLC